MRVWSRTLRRPGDAHIVVGRDRAGGHYHASDGAEERDKFVSPVVTYGPRDRRSESIGAVLDGLTELGPACSDAHLVFDEATLGERRRRYRPLVGRPPAVRPEAVLG